MWPFLGTAKARAPAASLTPSLMHTAARVTAREAAGSSAEGSGAAGGIVLPLQLVSNGAEQVSYTLPVLIGSNESPQNFSLQIDTGSSDLWVASSSCGSSVCKNAPGFSPVTASATGLNLDIHYLAGDISGPILWDTVTVGGYSVSNQAFASATTVDSEPLGSQFSGVLGLGPPGNSRIAGHIPPVLGNAPDGAVWASNLFSITPATSAPSSPFLSLALERPGSSTVPSVLGIGRHPASLVPNATLVEYHPLYQPAAEGPLFWKSALTGITVYTDSGSIPISLGHSVNGAYPSAVLDTGVSVILTTKTVANAIYGAIGIQADSSGNYYMPCTTPLNLTISLDHRREMPIHPLDLSTPPPSSSSNPGDCIGLIQTSEDAVLSNPASGIGDVILGVPFLRNVYTVLAFDAPLTNGTFSPQNFSTFAAVQPHLGLLGLTNATVAMAEFHRVRVLNEPIGDGSANVSVASSSGHKSVGIPVAIGVGSLVGACLLLFGVWWFVVRRQIRRHGDGDYRYDTKDGLPLTPLPTEDELRSRRHQAYMQSLHTLSTDRTQFELVPEEVPKNKDPPVLESHDAM